MSQTNYYDFRVLKNPTESELNALGAEGFYIVGTALDPRAQADLVVIMQRGNRSYLADGDYTTAYETDDMAADVAPVRRNGRKR